VAALAVAAATNASGPGPGGAPPAVGAPAGASPDAWAWGPDRVGGYASDRLMVKVAPGASITVDAGGVVRVRTRTGQPDWRVARALAEAAPTGAALAWTRPPADAARVRALGVDRWVVVRVPAGTDVPALAARVMLAAVGGATVQWAEVDAIGGVAEDAPVPNDPSWPLQWGMENTGQTVGGVPGTAGADIAVRGAWHVTRGTSRTIVAVLDSGVNAHSEFAGRLKPGWNVPAQSVNTDDQCTSHGTHVAGVIAAATDNGSLVAGIAPEVQILPIVVLNGCTGMSSWAADGLYWAVDSGATVANMSLQYSVGTQYFRDAVQYAYWAGIPLVAAAGNNGFAGVSWPAKWPEVIAVGSLACDDTPAASSGVGPEVEVAAPGVNVYSTVGTSGADYKSGTSMASPHVAGTLALMQAVAPALSMGDLRAALASTCVDVGAPGVDTSTGAGRIDAAAAVRQARALAGAADLDQDGLVSGADLGILLAAWGACGVPCPCDLNDDGVVDGGDLGVLLAAWGPVH
jgi:subtilisin family serine protease